MKINELEDILGVTRATIRYYEEQGLVTPRRSENGYRDYSDEEVKLFQKIIVLRKVGVGVPEIKDLIDGKADLHEELEHNMESLREQQSEITSALEMCGEIDSEAADFDSINSPKFLMNIYEAEQQGSHFAEAGEMNFRQLNLAITLLGFLAGVPTPQNKLYSEHANDSIPDDIRGNKKEGDEYDTIGDVLRKGGKRKTALIFAATLFIILAVCNGLAIWGGLGLNFKFVHDYNKSGIVVSELAGEGLADLTKIDPGIVNANDNKGVLRFHVREGLHLTVAHAENGSWHELGGKDIDAKEGYLYITGDPSSEIELHIIAGDKSISYKAQINDSTYEEGDTAIRMVDKQKSLYEDQIAVLLLRDDGVWEDMKGDMIPDPFGDALENAAPDGCYAIIAYDTK